MNMQKSKDYTLLALAIPFSIALLVNVLPYRSVELNKDLTCEQKKPIYVEYWKTGDTLLPDNICPDTLIVVDAIGLNKAMAYYEQGLDNPTEYALDSTMHVYCTIK